MAADDDKGKQPATGKEASTAGGLTFLVSTNPHDAQSAADKKRVRQAAALKSWRDMKSEYAGAQPSSKRHKISGQQQSSSRRLAPRPKVHHETTTWELTAVQPATQPVLGPVPFVDRTSAAGTTCSLPSSVSSLPSSTSSPGSPPPPLIPGPSPQASGSTSPVLQAPAPASRKRSRDQFSHSSQTHLPPKLLSQPSARGIGSARHGHVSHVHLSEGKTNVEQKGTVRRKGSLGPPVLRKYHSVLEQYPTARPCRTYCNDFDPFGCAPVEHKPWHDGILHHMLTVFAPRAWPTLKITTKQGLQWEHFMTQHALAEPALYYVRLLFATGDLIALKVANPQLRLWLQAQAIQAINEALTQPQRATSDALILAIGRIALHESLYGDKVAAHTLHRPAQQRMIGLRGGMGSLDFPPLVKRLMRWSDKVMSMQGGTPRMIPDDDEPHYTDTTSVDVLEKWAPSEGQALRKKVQTSELDDAQEQ